MPSGCLNTAEIGEHTHTPSGYINTAPINLICMHSDNLNTCAISKYTNMLGDDNHAVAIWSTYTPSSYPSTVEINIHTCTRLAIILILTQQI